MNETSYLQEEMCLKYNYVLVFSNQNLTMKQQFWISPSDIPLEPILPGDPKNYDAVISFCQALIL